MTERKTISLSTVIIKNFVLDSTLDDLA